MRSLGHFEGTLVALRDVRAMSHWKLHVVIRVTAVGENYLACWELLWIATDRYRHILLSNQYNGMGKRGIFHGSNEEMLAVKPWALGIMNDQNTCGFPCLYSWYGLHTHSHTRHRNWAGIQPSFGDLFLWHVVFHPHYGETSFLSPKVTSGLGTWFGFWALQNPIATPSHEAIKN